jgi:hypothetical protein
MVKHLLLIICRIRAHFGLSLLLLILSPLSTSPFVDSITSKYFFMYNLSSMLKSNGVISYSQKLELEPGTTKVHVVVEFVNAKHMEVDGVEPRENSENVTLQKLTI